jgi:hypothetical protein
MIQKHFHPFVGNGKIGLDIHSIEEEDKTGLWIKGKRGLEQQLPFHPLVNVHQIPLERDTVRVLRVREGLVHRITTFPHDAHPVIIHETIYIHRVIPGLIVQEIRVSNPSPSSLTISFHRHGWKGSQTPKTSSLKVRSSQHGQSQDKEFIITEGDIKSSEGNLVIGFVVASPSFPSSIEVPSNGKSSFIFNTLINYTQPTPSSRLSYAMMELKSSVVETAKKVSGILSTVFLKHHRQGWNDLWKSGFGISLSKADNIVNGDDINTTIYYILSHKEYFSSPDSLSDHSLGDIVPASKKFLLLLDHPDRCYSGNPTLQAPNLWTPLSDSESVARVVKLWLLTLEKNGCGNLLSAGAEGTLEAMILSFVSMQFHQNHLEMGIHPKELHRDYFIRRIRYSNNTFINVTMTVGQDYHASIYVILDQKPAVKLLACDAGCLDPPVELTSDSLTRFPVKITEPLTPILYMTHDRQHVLELKDAIHVKEVAVAPAHETHVIALHRHGHQFGGLPAIFWASIFVLVVLFHVFLAKLIYNEYFGSNSSSSISSYPGVSYERFRRAV